MGTTAMGRRKIDIAYLPDDRVRKVTFCKRKGGLFKKADDLSKLCGVEVAVLIVSDTKTCEYASTDVSRILQRYQALRAGDSATMETSETHKLWLRLENQRRELENLTRQLAEERRKVEELKQVVPGQMRAVEMMGVNSGDPQARGLHAAAAAAAQAQLVQQVQQLHGSVGVVQQQPQLVSSLAGGMILAQPIQQQQQQQQQVVPQMAVPVVHAPSPAGVLPPTEVKIDSTQEADTEGVAALFEPGEHGDDDASDDTAEAESLSEDIDGLIDEPAPKRARVDHVVSVDSCEQQQQVADECERSAEVAAPISAAMAASVVAEMHAPAVHIV